MKLDPATLKIMQTLSNGFAGERVESVLEEIETKIKGTDGRLVWSAEQVKNVIGRMLAVAYAKGFADCYEKEKPRTLFI